MTAFKDLHKINRPVFQHDGMGPLYLAKMYRQLMTSDGSRISLLQACDSPEAMYSPVGGPTTMHVKEAFREYKQQKEHMMMGGKS